MNHALPLPSVPFPSVLTLVLLVFGAPANAQAADDGAPANAQAADDGAPANAQAADDGAPANEQTDDDGAPASAQTDDDENASNPPPADDDDDRPDDSRPDDSRPDDSRPDDSDGHADPAADPPSIDDNGGALGGSDSPNKSDSPPDAPSADAPSSSDDSAPAGSTMEDDAERARPPDELVDGPLTPLPDDRPTTSALAVTAQVATGAAACCCGLPLVAAVGLPLLIVPIAGPFLGPCALQGGFCATNAVLGGAAEVFVGDALGPGHGALLPVIGAQAAAHLAASLIATVVGTVALGTAATIAAPNLPTDPAGAVAYLNNDPGILLAAAFTVAVFAAAITASLATGPIVYALTAVPKETERFQLPRWSRAEAAPPSASDRRSSRSHLVGDQPIRY